MRVLFKGVVLDAGNAIQSKTTPNLKKTNRTICIHLYNLLSYGFLRLLRLVFVFVPKIETITRLKHSVVLKLMETG